MKLVYGMQIPVEIFNYIKGNDNISQAENIGFYELDDKNSCYGLLIEENLQPYLEIDTTRLNEVSASSDTYNLFNDFLPKVLKEWVNFIEYNTTKLKEEGKTETEVSEVMQKFEFANHIEIKIFAIK